MAETELFIGSFRVNLKTKKKSLAEVIIALGFEFEFLTVLSTFLLLTISMSLKIMRFVSLILFENSFKGHSAQASQRGLP